MGSKLTSKVDEIFSNLFTYFENTVHFWAALLMLPSLNHGEDSHHASSLVLVWIPIDTTDVKDGIYWSSCSC